MVTAFPREKVETWGEKLIVPAISLFILCFLPLAFVPWMSLPSLAFAIGQFMLFRRSAYDAIGGYEQVRGDVVDDVALARRIIRQGYRWRIMDGTRHVFCRMYRGFGDAADGFTKNLFAYFNHHVVLYMVAWLWIEVAFILPPVVLLAHGFGISVEYFPRTLALLATGASLLCWLIAYRRFRFPLVLILLYPLTLTLFVGIALRSMAFNLAGKATWKDRELIPPLWNW
jgi:chlorobactene glucosyltransferase